MSPCGPFLLDWLIRMNMAIDNGAVYTPWKLEGWEHMNTYEWKQIATKWFQSFNVSQKWLRINESS